MGSDDIFDILLLILVIAILTPIMVSNAIPMFKGDVGGFNTLIEKTAQETTGEIKSEGRFYTREDILLMALVADRKMPQPAKFQVIFDKNGNNVLEENANMVLDEISEVITIEQLLTQRVEKLNILNEYVLPGEELKIQTYIGSSGIEKWVVSGK